MRSKLWIVMLLLYASFSLKINDARAQTDSCFAAYVVSYTPGVTKDGQPYDISKNFDDDYRKVVGSAMSDTSSLSLGIGGEIILGFLNPVPVGPGGDLWIDERDGLTSSNPEKVDVSVSLDGSTFIPVKTNMAQGGIINFEDVALSLTEFKYVKLKDVSSPDDGNNGFDLDRVVALHGCGTECPVKPNAMLTNTEYECPDGSATLKIALTGEGPWTIGYTNGPGLGVAEVEVGDLIGGEASVPFSMEGTVKLSWVTDKNNCTRLIDDGKTVFIAEPVDAYFNDNIPQTVCMEENEIELTVVLIGKSPWTYQYTITHGEQVDTITKTVNKPGKDKVTVKFKTTQPGEYTMIWVEDACSDQQLIGDVDGGYRTLELIEKPTAQLMNPGTLCTVSDDATLEVALTGQAPWQLSWTVNGTEYTEAGIEEPTFMLPVSENGTYILTQVQSASVCEGIILPDSMVTVLSSSVAQLQEKDTVLCDPEAKVELKVQLQGAAPFTFAYTRDGNLVETIETSEEEYTLSVAGLGTYALAWVRNACGDGQVSGGANISAASATLAGYSYHVLDQTCNTATLELAADSVEDHFQYRWYMDNQLIGTNSKIQYQASSWNMMKVALAVTSGYCSDSTIQELDIESVIAGKLGRFQWSEEGTLTCEGLPVAFVSDSTHSTFTYQWKINGELANQKDSFTQTLAPGVYDVQLMLNDGNCLYSSRQEILVPEFSMADRADFTYTLAEDRECGTQPAEFSAIVVDDALSYRWFINSTEVSQQPSFAYDLPVGESEVRLEVAQGECSYDTNQSITVEDMSLNQAGAFEYDYEPISCSEWSLSATALDLGEEIQYQWWLDGEPVGTQELLTVTLAPGEHLLRLRTKAGGCHYEVEESLSIPVDESLVNVPNVLSPHASHPDDRVVKVYGNCLGAEGFHWQVMDRWGSLVYETRSLEDAMMRGWDGGNHSAGVYTYSLRARFDTGTAFQKQGTITLLK